MSFYNYIQKKNFEIPKYTHDLRIAGILDELSEKFFPYECYFENLSFYNWEKQITQLQPHILFVESIWNGLKKSWRNKFLRNNEELIHLINWCKERGIPTVFWNKEDPIHVFTFMGVASLFDFVFTTDLDCVPLYKRLLGHNRVGVLPFATAIQLFNPIEKYKRKDSACFAGSYYAKREERRIDFENLADSLLKYYSLDIYDRDPYPGNPDYTFPARFRPHIQGSLPVEQIDIAYKSYKIGVTLNIVKHSSTMEARRIFELLGSNTFTVSNACLGIKNLFGDLVLQFENSEQFGKKLSNLLEDDSAYNRLRLLGLRKVLQQHTYKERLEYLYKILFNQQPVNSNPNVAIFSVVNSEKEINYIIQAFERQMYDKKHLFLFASKDDSKLFEIYPQLLKTEQFITELFKKFDYCGYFSPNNYYGPNYLTDLTLAARFADVSVIGKSAYYDAINGTPEYHEELGAYNLIDQIKSDRSVFLSHLVPKVVTHLDHLDNYCFENLPCLSIDSFNFCKNLRTDSCGYVDDLIVNEGINIEDLFEISHRLTMKEQNYRLGTVLTSEDLKQNFNHTYQGINLYDHPLGYFAFYNASLKQQKILFENNIDFSKDITIEELTGKPILNIFLNAQVEGNVNFYIHYFNLENKYLGGYLLTPKACTIIPVPEKSNYCKFVILTNQHAYGFIKEVIIGPKLTHSINLP